MKKEGEDFFGNSNDKTVYLPVNYFKTLVDLKEMGTTIAVKARPLVSNAELKDELTGIMRSIRKIKPSAEDNFAINETDIIAKGFDSLFSVIAMVGWIIGGFPIGRRIRDRKYNVRFRERKNKYHWDPESSWCKKLLYFVAIPF